MGDVYPEMIKAMAVYFGVDVGRNGNAGELYLLPAVRSALQSKVPPPWRQTQDEDDYKFLRLIQTLRKTYIEQKGPLECWMEFKDENGNSYYHNFMEHYSTTEAPHPRELLKPLPSFLTPSSKDIVPYITIDKLVFQTWWFEDHESKDLSLRHDTDTHVGGGVKKRVATLYYDLVAQNMQVELEEQGVGMLLENVECVTEKDRLPITCWDLYVGARIIMLGKSVGVHWANVETTDWLESRIQALNNLRIEAIIELEKYGSDKTPINLKKPRLHVKPGYTNIQRLIDIIKVLISSIQDYRPKRASEFWKLLNKILDL